MVQATFKVRGGIDHVDPVNQLESYDTWSTIVAATAETYGISSKQAEAALRKANPNIPNAKRYFDPKCNDWIMDIRVKDDQVIKLPGDKEINPELVTRPCVKPQPVPVGVDPAGSEIKITPPATQDVEAPLLAQFAPPPSGPVELGYAVQRWNYMFGEPPKRAAGKEDHKPGRLRDGVILPEGMEGASTKLRNKDDVTGALRDGEAGRVRSGRAREELTYAPEETYTRQANGVLVPNPHFNQKLEEFSAKQINGEGKTIDVVLGGALISIKARNNPEHEGIFTDVKTAMNIVGKWNATGKAVTVVTDFQGIQQGYPVVADRFFKAEPGKATAADARALLEMNVSLALNPILWSVNSRGIPVADTRAIATAMDKVFDSQSFKSLPPEQQTQLTGEFKPLQALHNKPRAMLAAVGGEAGVAKLYQPLEELAVERAQLKFIQKGFGRGVGERPDGVEKADWRAANAANLGLQYAREVRVEARIAPTDDEYRIGTGIAFDAKRQSAQAITKATGDTLRQIQGNDALLRNVITQIANTPGAPEKLFGRAFDASMKRYKDNHRIYDKPNDAEADKFADRMGVALGGEVYKGHMDYRARNVVDTLANIPADLLGFERSGTNRNQNRGTFVKDKDGQYHVMSKDFNERWNNGTGAGEAEIFAFFKNELLPSTISAHDKGFEQASTSFMSALSAQLDAHANGRKQTANHKTIETALGGKVLLDAFIAQANAHEQLGAEVERGTKFAAMSGRNIVTASEADIAKAIAEGKDTVTIAGVKPGDRTIDGVTGLNLDAARAARNAVAAGLVMDTSNNPDRVAPGSTNRDNVAAAATAQAAAFSMVVLQTAAKLDGDAAKRMRGYLEIVDKGDKDFSRYADGMKDHLKAYNNAKDPAGRAAAEKAAYADLQGYFAGESKHEGARAAAVQRLAGMMAKDGEISAAFTAELQAVAKAELAANPDLRTHIAQQQATQALGGAATKAAGKTTFAAPATALLSTAGIDQLTSLATGKATSPETKIELLTALIAAGGITTTTLGTNGLPNPVTLNAAQLKTLEGIVVAGGTPGVVTTALTHFSTNNGTALNAGSAKPAAPAPAKPLLDASGIGMMLLIAKEPNLTAEQKAAQVDKAIAENAAVSRPLTAQQLTDLKAIVVKGGTPEAVTAALQGFNAAAQPATSPNAPLQTAPVLTAAQVASLTTSLNVANGNVGIANAALKAVSPAGDKAGNPVTLNAAQLTQLQTLLTNNPDVSAVNALLAGIAAGNNNPNTGVNAGKPGDGLNAGKLGDGINAGKLGDGLNAGKPGDGLNAGKPVLSGAVSPADTEAALAGIRAGFDALGAYSGVSWKAWIAALSPILIPGGGTFDPSTILDDPIGCMMAGRSCIPPGVTPGGR